MPRQFTMVVDAFPLLFRRAGIGRYTYELVRNMGLCDPRVTTYLANFGWGLSRTRVPVNNTTEWLDRSLPVYRYHAVAFNLIPPFLRRRIVAAQAANKADVFLGVNFLGIFHHSFPTVLTVHDMAYHVFPEHAHPAMRRALERRLDQDVNRAARVIADSHATKRDVVRILGTPPDKVTVVPLAVGEEFKPVTDEIRYAQVRKQYQLPERYILFVGTLEPRKNLLTLFDAFARLCETTGFSQKLVLVGARGWNSDAIMKRVEDLQSRGLARYLGYVTDVDLPAIYSMADVFAFPSHYEGFGIPPLEAMACGVPVVTTNVSSLPEVVGEAAIQVEVGDIDALAASIRRILDDPDMAARMRTAGIARAATFSWRKTTEQTLAELKSVSRRST